MLRLLLVLCVIETIDERKGPR